MEKIETPLYCKTMLRAVRPRAIIDNYEILLIGLIAIAIGYAFADVSNVRFIGFAFALISIMLIFWPRLRMLLGRPRVTDSLLVAKKQIEPRFTDQYRNWQIQWGDEICIYGKPAQIMGVNIVEYCVAVVRLKNYESDRTAHLILDYEINRGGGTNSHKRWSRDGEFLEGGIDAVNEYLAKKQAMRNSFPKSTH